MRIFYSFMPPIFGGRLWTTVATWSLMIPAVGIGLAVRTGVAAPDISSAEGLKRAVMDADSLAYTNLATGIYFGRLLERLGIAGEVKGKTSLYSSGAAVFDHVLKGKGNDVGIGPVTTIMALAPRWRAAIAL